MRKAVGRDNDALGPEGQTLGEGRMLLKAGRFDDPNQLALFGSIKTSPDNRLGVDGSTE